MTVVVVVVGETAAVAVVVAVVIVITGPSVGVAPPLFVISLVGTEKTCLGL